MIDLKNKAENISGILKIIGNKDRLKLLCFLIDEERNVSEISRFLNISQSQTSQFLQKMKLQNILFSKKKGKEIFYSIKNKNIIKLVKSIKNIYC